MTTLANETTIRRTALRTRIRTYLSVLPKGHQFTMGDIYAITGESSGTVDRRYREARGDLEARGWEFMHNGRVHRITATGA